jgi:putative hydrolase of HD superfamily
VVSISCRGGRQLTLTLTSAYTPSHLTLLSLLPKQRQGPRSSRPDHAKYQLLNSFLMFRVTRTLPRRARFSLRRLSLPPAIQRFHPTRIMPVDESTQTNGIPSKTDSQAATLPPAEAASHRWTVESALSTITPRYAENTTSPIPFFHLLERLKTTPRAGWKRFGISHCESISDHMYRMSILTMMAPRSLSSKLDILKCCRMALIHDMAEALVGDITPVDPVSKEEKSRRETETMDYICTNLLGKFNGGLNGKDVREIWQEYEDSETLESHFVHDVDKMELLLQMIEYERVHEGSMDLGEFSWVATKIQSKEVKAWADHVFWERVKLWEGFGREPKWSYPKPETEPAPL